MDKFTLILNPENTETEYNSSIEFSVDIQYLIDKHIGEIFEIEFLSKKIEHNFPNKTITYFFNVTKEKEAMVLDLIKQIPIGLSPGSMDSISLN